MSTDIGLFILRVAAGASLLVGHGLPKLKNFTGTVKWFQSERFPLVFLSATALIAAEVLGSIMLILGIYVQYVAWIIAFAMLVATLYDLRKGKSWDGGVEPPFLFLIIMMLLGFAGGGAWTLG
jgi:uncharacterized membrane protein YphA (DoxX/SURF4 family)